MPGTGEEAFGSKLLRGFKLGLSFFLFLPFLLFFLPLWWLHRQGELRAGRPAPQAPWNVLCSAMDRIPKRHPSPLPAGEASAPASRMPIVPTRPAGKVALVTGGSDRIGAMICRELSAIGFDVALTYHHSGPKAQRLVSELTSQGTMARCYPLDLANPQRISALVEAVEQQSGPITLLVNNAGYFHADAMECGWDNMEKLMKVNLQGPLWLSMRVAQAMRQSRVQGQIISLGDIWGERTLTGHACYGAAKAGMIMATRVLARDLAPQVRVNAILPGAVLPPASPHPGFMEMLARTPLRDQAGPEGIVQALRYLLEAQFVTGEIMHVDGGRHLT
ncbi:MAG: SDR family oxidoreductase [Magnetococcales bacterium]|nr:SDR family oxidoreductase [Magnetococcales bacterium]